VPVLLLVIAVHGRNLGDFFLSDDFTLLRRASEEPLGAWLLWPDPSRSGWFRPLTEATWRLAYLAFALRPEGHHALNLGLHLLNVSLVFAIASCFYGSRVSGASAAALFGVHPLSPAAVAWLSCRYDLLATGFVLLTVLLLLRPPGPRRWIWVGLASAGAVLSKELAYVLPLVAAIVVLGRPQAARSSWRRLWSREISAVLAVVAALVAVKVAALGGLGGYGVHAQWPPHAKWAPPVLWAYAWQPLDLTPFSPRRFAAWLAVGAAGVALSAHGAVWVLCAVASALPVSNLLPPYALIATFELGRMVYLPSAFAALAISSALAWRTQRWPRALRHAPVIVLVTVGCVSFWRAQVSAGAWAEAGRISAATHATLRAAASSLPPHSAVDCSPLPDNVRGAYLYRNGCDDHVRLVVPDRTIRGVRFVPGIPPDPVSARLAEFARVYRFSADGTRLTLEAPPGPPGDAPWSLDAEPARQPGPRGPHGTAAGSAAMACRERSKISSGLPWAGTTRSRPLAR
jgi:hypothetical protein